MQSTKDQQFVSDVLLSPPCFWIICYNLLMIIGIVLFWLAFTTPVPAAVFGGLCTVCSFFLIGLMHNAMRPVLDLRKLAIRICKIPGVRLHSSIPKAAEYDDVYLEGPNHPIELIVPLSLDWCSVSEKISLHMRLLGFACVSQEALGKSTSGTRMLFRKRMVYYEVSCCMRKYRPQDGTALCVLHVMRQVS